MVALPVTVNGVLIPTDVGAVAVTPDTLTSVGAVMTVNTLVLALLLHVSGSVTCAWSICAQPVTVNWCVDGLEQVTVHDAGEAGTMTGEETASDVSCTVCGLGDEVVQSGGRLNVRSTSTFVGPYGPKL